MAEVEDAPKMVGTPYEIVLVRYRCDACNAGDMKTTDTVYTVEPPLYEHACEACGARAALARCYPYTYFTHKPAEPTVEDMKRQRDLLGAALGKVLVAAGMIRDDVDMTGPELLGAAEDFCRAPNAEFHTTAILVGRRVERDDGRFYIPLNRAENLLVDVRSRTVARVASDAFDTVDEAERFALDFASAWNISNRHFD